jgi:hypothetical protein
VGANIELQLPGSEIPFLQARIITSDPRAGNGIQFIDLPPEYRDALANYLDLQKSKEAPRQPVRRQ